MEKRHAPRIQISLEVTYEDGNEFISSYLFDISGGGVFIRTDEPLDPGRKVRVCFHVPDMANSVTATGTVAWSQDSKTNSRPGMGICFEEMDPGDRERLERFLREHGE